MRARFARAAFSALITGTVIAACGTAAVAPSAADPDPSRARAALATLRVDNRTNQRVLVLYRFANRTAPDVGIGHVDGTTVAELAPVPAGEPLVLIARTAAGTELRLEPRTFEIDGSWTWQIDRGARFVRPTGTP
jgi:hypothetical protein